MKRTIVIWSLFAAMVGGALLLGQSCPSEVVPYYDYGDGQAPIPKSPHPDDAGIYVTQDKSMFIDIPDSDRRSNGGIGRRDRGRDRERKLFSRLREWIERFRAKREQRREDR